MINKLKNFVLIFLVMVALLSVGGISHAADPEVAGAEIYVNPTPTPTPTPTSTPSLSPSLSPTPSLTVTVSPSPLPSDKSDGFLGWLMEPLNLLWLGIAALVIIVSIYLGRRKRAQSPA